MHRSAVVQVFGMCDVVLPTSIAYNQASLCVLRVSCGVPLLARGRLPAFHVSQGRRLDNQSLAPHVAFHTRGTRSSLQEVRLGVLALS